MGKEGCMFLGSDKEEKIRRHLPPGSGEYSVGCVDIMNDHTENGCFFCLYYPVEKTDIYKRNAQWPLWLPRKQYAMGYAHFLKKNPKKLFGRFFHWLGGDVYIPALWQAPVRQTDGQYPVVILSHGIGGNRTTYSTFCCELASHGFVVAALEHRDGSASMTYHLRDNVRRNTVELVRDASSGKQRRQALHKSHSFTEEWKPFEHTDPMGISWDDFQYRNKQVHRRAEECSRLLDVLTDINNGCSTRNFLGFHFSLKQFKNLLDMSRVAIAGHSFGGSTCVATLAKDPRFKTGIMLDAWMHPLDAETSDCFEQPLLLINYEKFQWRKNVEQMKVLERADSETVMITMLGAGHQAISDFQFICSKTVGKYFEVRSDISPKKAMEINSKATLSFLWKHLDVQGKPYHGDILEGRHDNVILGTTFQLT